MFSIGSNLSLQWCPSYLTLLSMLMGSPVGGTDALAEMPCRALRRLGARRVRLRGGWTATGAERALSARRSSRHQRNALTGDPDSEPQLRTNSRATVVIHPDPSSRRWRAASPLSSGRSFLPRRPRSFPPPAHTSASPARPLRAAAFSPWHAKNPVPAGVAVARAHSQSLPKLSREPTPSSHRASGIRL